MKHLQVLFGLGLFYIVFFLSLCFVFVACEGNAHAFEFLGGQATISNYAAGTIPGNEGPIIKRFFNQTRGTLRYGDLEVIGGLDLNLTQDWHQRVRDEEDMWAVDGLRIKTLAGLQYWFSDHTALRVNYTLPLDRHNNSVGDGWAQRESYQLDVGIYSEWR